jgi:enoyl-[acyl-carrier protein] reductase III
VLELARRGADVLVNYLRNSDAAERTVEEARALGVQAEPVRGHVGDEQKVERLFAGVRERYGYLDILVNNAASGVNRPALELTARHWDWTLNINARGAWLCAQHAARLMEGRQGKIVNISSLGGGRVLREYFLVGISKAALEGLTRYLAVELAPLGINVNAISGGLVETEALAAFSWGQEAVEEGRRRIPAGRMVEPEDLARVVAFLCTDAASMIRGQTIVVDGGLSLVV